MACPIVPDIFLKNLDVIPAKAGIHIKKSLKLKILKKALLYWIPAYAGMT
ncbi:MAG TPA: hypothetical protein LFV92_02020 [Rickettsia endosymbiont of Ceroptres masudai]|nr:hypothetical protein [Rickettsia endosymbiont of Ceroptres masudai]